MQDISVEQILKTKAPASAMVWKVVMILACCVAVITIPATYALGVLLFAVLLVATVFIFRYFNAEFEYALVDTDFSIDRIAARSSRKHCNSYNLAKTTLFARVGSQDALRQEHQQLRTFHYTANDGSGEEYVLYTMNSKNELERVLIQPDERMLEAMKLVIPKEAFKIEKV